MSHTQPAAPKTFRALTLSLLALGLLSGPALALNTNPIPAVKIALPSPIKTVPSVLNLSGSNLKNFSPFVPALSVSESYFLAAFPGGIKLDNGGKGPDGADGLAGILVSIPKDPKLPTLSRALEFPVVEENSALLNLNFLFDNTKVKKSYAVPSKAEHVLAD